MSNMANVLLDSLMSLAPYLCKFAESVTVRRSLAARPLKPDEDMDTALNRPNRMLARDMHKVDRALSLQTDGSNLGDDLKNPQVLKGTSARAFKGTDPKLDKQVKKVQDIYNNTDI